jgi:peptide deformylase
VEDLIVQTGDPVLRKEAKPVAEKDIGSRKLAALIGKMQRALAKEPNGVAIAAPQVGVSLRLFVVSGKVFDDGAEPKNPKEDTAVSRVFINPKITRVSKKMVEMSEGCLSVRGKYGTVLRHQKVTLEALDERGASVHYNASGLLGHVFQHECDHLDGILYIDKAIRVEEDNDLQTARNKQKHGI